MSKPSLSASSPPRRRDGNWPDSHPPSSYGYDYDGPSSPYSRGPPPPGYHYGGPPPPAPYRSFPGGPPPPQPQRPPPPADYWSYEPPRGANYWGPPPPYEGYPPPERHMPPPARVPRGLPPPPQQQQQQPPRPFISPGNEDQLRRAPPSPTGYPRPHPTPQSMRDFRPPHSSGGHPADQQNVPKDKKTGDPLSILANVSAGMSGKDGRKSQQQQDQQLENQQEQHPSDPHRPAPAPTSPVTRRTRHAPMITPNQTPPDHKTRPIRRQITPGSGSRGGPPDGLSYWEEQHQRHETAPPTPQTPHHYDSSPGYYPPRRRHPYYDYPAPHDGPPPALVERGSFDSQGDGPPLPPPPPPYRSDMPYTPQHMPPPYYEDHPHPPPQYPHHGGPPYWENAPPPPPLPPPRSPYPPPRWNYGPYPEPHPDYPYEGRGSPVDDKYPPPPHHVAPYTYVQQPRLEEKTILRKKFSWKHYPELEKFLISNRDDYLKHSSMNYTAEQKQYNNWLTERLLEVADQHNYAFDQEDFNFVAIRDRIRCYYKSYVQTARKRGLKLPLKKKD